MLYKHDEYREKQIELSGKESLLKKLDAVHTGLETVVSATQGGLFSFQGLLGLSADNVHFFDGKTIYKALTHSEVTQEQLEILKDYGKILMVTAEGAAKVSEKGRSNYFDMLIAGNLIYNLAIAQALNKYSVKISRFKDAQLKRAFDELSEEPYIVPSIKEILENGARQIAGNFGSDHIQ